MCKMRINIDFIQIMQLPQIKKVITIDEIYSGIKIFSLSYRLLLLQFCTIKYNIKCNW